MNNFVKPFFYFGMTIGFVAEIAQGIVSTLIVLTAVLAIGELFGINANTSLATMLSVVVLLTTIGILQCKRQS